MKSNRDRFGGGAKVAAVAALAVVAASCGAGAGDGEGASQSRVVIAEHVQPDNWDPAMNLGGDINGPVGSTVFETLAVATLDGEIEPRLATEWHVSKDGKTYTFKLRDDVSFHNGETFEADDVVYSVERAMEKAVPQVVQRFATLAGVEAVDDTTVRFELKQPDSAFIYSVADPTGIGFGILNREAGEEGASTKPVGTGPFRFESYRPNASLTLSVNRDYWDPSVLPEYEELEIRFISEDQSQVAALRSGSVSVIRPTGVSTVKSLRGENDLTEHELQGVGFWLSISRKGITAPKEVANAIALSVDREALAQLAFQGEAEPGTSAHPLLDYGATPDELPNYQRDTAKARELLAQAGHPDGIDLNFMYPTREPFDDAIFEALQSSLAEGGIRVKLQPIEPTPWVERLLAADYDLTMTDQTWYSDPTRYVLPREGWQADTEQVVPELVPLLTELSTASEDERPEVFRRVQELEAEHSFPFVGTVWTSESVFSRSDLVSNVNVEELVTGSRRLYYLSLEPA